TAGPARKMTWQLLQLAALRGSAPVFIGPCSSVAYTVQPHLLHPMRLPRVSHGQYATTHSAWLSIGELAQSTIRAHCRMYPLTGAR
ncbi:uncharacterized protein B0H18DRAFT_1014393, partial [Fomitopsis serialis]|uniref:uncharacterized protein n=1 Tax=Fomitopsis serialis TaxID=139415 RepID=UPI0020088868